MERHRTSCRLDTSRGFEHRARWEWRSQSLRVVCGFSQDDTRPGGGFVGAIDEGGSVNFRDILFNPHGHGTHTECLGHITPVIHPVDPLFRGTTAHFPCLATSVTPQRREEDLRGGRRQLEALPNGPWPPALVVRTLPNDDAKRTKAWSNTNPYFTVAFMDKLVQQGVLHLLVDLPSVDREVDGGRLEAHHAFWRVPDNPRQGCSITELIYMPPVRQTGCTSSISAWLPWTTTRRSAALCFIPWSDPPVAGPPQTHFPCPARTTRPGVLRHP